MLCINPESLSFSLINLIKVNLTFEAALYLLGNVVSARGLGGHQLERGVVDQLGGVRPGHLHQ